MYTTALTHMLGCQAVAGMWQHSVYESNKHHTVLFHMGQQWQAPMRVSSSTLASVLGSVFSGTSVLLLLHARHNFPPFKKKKTYSDLDIIYFYKEKL